MCEKEGHAECGYVGTDCSGDEPLTKQEFARDADINVLIARFTKAGVPLPGPEVAQAFADVSEIGDFQACQERIIRAQDAFMKLPSDVRQRFGNEPAALLAFLDNPANLDEAVRMGLVVLKEPKAPEKPAPVAAPVVVPPKSPEETPKAV